MRFFHFSKNNFNKEFDPQKNHCVKKHASPFKPVGLWLSIENNNNGWRNFCLKENFRTECLTNCYEIKLKSTTNLKLIDSAEELKIFHNKYKECQDKIDWEKVYKDYDGITFCPFKRSFSYRENMVEYFWYTTVDCDSSCVWNFEKIEEIVPVYENVTNLNKIKKIKLS